MEENPELQMIWRYIISGWPTTREEVEPRVERYWPIRYELAMIEGIVMKGRHIIIPCLLQKQILE